MRRISSALVVVLGFVTLSLTAVCPAQAQPYPPDEVITVETPTVTTGGTVRVSARGFNPGETVNFVANLVQSAAMQAPVPRPAMAQIAAPIAAPVGTASAVANAAGVATADIPVGSTAGTVEITATGADSGNTGVTTVQVSEPLGAVRPPAAGGSGGSGGTTGGTGSTTTGGMPPTGTNGRALLWQVLLASVAIGVGGALVFATARRRKPRRTE